MMLYEMFQHTVDQGWKRGGADSLPRPLTELPKLDPKVDISAIQLAGPQTSKEEIQSLNLEVYNCRDCWVSTQRAGTDGGCGVFLEDCQGWKQREAPEMAARSQSKDVQAALEEEIEQLTCPLIRSWSEVQECSKSRDCHVHRSREQKRRHHQV